MRLFLVPVSTRRTLLYAQRLGVTTRDPSSATLLDLEVVFPPSVIAEGRVESVAGRLATERQALHRRQMMWCLVGMPITAPFALVPIIPNLPFFYLAYRAFSNWRAIAGGKHVQWLIENKLLSPAPSAALDLVYAQAPAPGAEERAGEEEILLTRSQIRACTDALAVPELETELDRAVWQIEQELRNRKKGGAGCSPAATEKKGESEDKKKQ